MEHEAPVGDHQDVLAKTENGCKKISEVKEKAKLGFYIHCGITSSNLFDRPLIQKRRQIETARTYIDMILQSTKQNATSFVNPKRAC